jgi:hypothetical protein
LRPRPPPPEEPRDDTEPPRGPDEEPREPEETDPRDPDEEPREPEETDPRERELAEPLLEVLPLDIEEPREEDRLPRKES